MGHVGMAHIYNDQEEELGTGRSGRRARLREWDPLYPSDTPKQKYPEDRGERPVEYNFGNGVKFSVGPSTRISDFNIPVCKLCRHLNPDFIEADKYTLLCDPWASRLYQQGEKLRSCTMRISKGQDFARSAARPGGCDYCGLLCRMLSIEHPGWETDQCLIEINLAWDLPIFVRLDYGHTDRIPNPGLDEFTPDIENHVDGVSRKNGLTVSTLRHTQAEIIEIFRPMSPLHEETCLLGLHQLGYQPPRSKHSDDGSIANFMRTWVKICRDGDQGHENCLKRSKTFMPDKVLFIGNDQNPTMHLFNAKFWADRGIVDEYIALSYCWGQESFLKSTKENIASFHKEIRWDMLPPLFQDVVRIAKGLDVPFVWIDSLCIVQDDELDWKIQAPKMGDIYANAFLTVAAASSSSPADGILGERPTRWHTRTTTITNPLNGVSTDLCVRQRAIDMWGTAREANPDYLDSRAWIWQERILSTRTIVFTKAALRFECRSTSIWEDQLFQGHSWSARMNEPVHIHWKRLMEDFTARNMTCAGDRLPAISSVMARVSAGQGLTPIAGMWKENLVQNLHWMRNDLKDRNHAGQGHQEGTIPSWSWASIGYPVQWTLGTADQLPYDDKKWTLHLIDVLDPAATDGASQSAGPVLDLVGTAMPALLRSYPPVPEENKPASYRLVVDGKNEEWQVFHADGALEARHLYISTPPTHRTVYRRSPGMSPDPGGWQATCALLQLVVYGITATSLVLTESGTRSGRQVWQRVGLLQHYRVEAFHNRGHMLRLFLE
ncbi:heterokaryon incompatibility protein-domain-containing protein [Truncatella angustata]|uniref:Heterokaryon incompatibility protein-domain-containing protein n=1 Tax=Truncatella angustata TaxID=152316 RepID=A0A9P9A146_9PEZI|nr:heterokaryon incompatibility protein-domain-containing protein [Truncatella angustata]KAH6659131.1 heterokaryon incompatibility protein-domain-containing protein [Truncatella angustata]